jgi:glutamate dehydrogenase
MGVPEKLANKISLLLLTRAAVDIVDLANHCNRDVIESARLYSSFNDALGLQWLHNSAEDLTVSGRWQARARGNLREDFYRLRRQIGDNLLTKRGTRDSREIARRWLAKHEKEVQQFTGMIDEMKLRENIDFATLSVAAQELRDLIAS